MKYSIPYRRIDKIKFITKFKFSFPGTESLELSATCVAIVDSILHFIAFVRLVGGIAIFFCGRGIVARIIPTNWL